jgi:hypothetical protein
MLFIDRVVLQHELGEGIAEPARRAGNEPRSGFQIGATAGRG